MTGNKDRSRRASGLTEEEAALWHYVTLDVERNRGKSRVPARPLQAEDEMADRARVAAPAPRGRRQEPRQQSPAPPAPAPTHEPVRPVVLDRRKARRIANGGQEIEARLDLHGLTQDEAHRALEHFVRRCAQSDIRTVLVITGKGAPSHDDAQTDSFARRERGVLRRMVPLWLDSPSLRPLVISWSSAHTRHGGHGAIYVALRRTA